MNSSEARAAWRALAAKADQFFDSVHEAYADAFSCKAGCDSCCQVKLSVLLPEALVVARAVAALPEDARQAIRKNLATGVTHCDLLVDGRCSIYTHRPLRCRTHGLPLLQREDQDRVSLSCCPLNFEGVEDFPRDAVLDEAVLVAGLSVVDAMLRRANGLDEQRIALADLAENGESALPALP